MRLKLVRKRPFRRSEEGQVVAKLGTIQRPSVQREGGRKRTSHQKLEVRKTRTIQPKT